MTEQSILALAPDTATAGRAKSLVKPHYWQRPESNGRAAWAEFATPGDPFHVAVDLQGPAFKCSCPVRRLPCKHGLGLLLLHLQKNDAFRSAEAPVWVAAWLKKRDARSAKNAPAPSLAGELGGEGEAPLPPDPEKEQALAEQRQHTRHKRLQHISAGLAELESWLTDLFRQGLAMLEGQGADYWQQLSARMVDAKMASLARRIRTLPELMGLPDWHERLCEEIGDIYLLMRGLQRLESLPEPLQDDLLQLAGVNLKKEEVLARPGLSDRWLVAGQTLEPEENSLLARRTWLLGESSGRKALLLEYAFGGRDFEAQWQLGSILSGELAFYPAAYPQRALFKSFTMAEGAFQGQADSPANPLPDSYRDDSSNPQSEFEAFAQCYAEALAANPWLSPFPALFEAVVPVFEAERFWALDAKGKQLPLIGEETTGWKLLALSGGRPIRLFGQWDGKAFLPLSTWGEGGFRLLHKAERPD